MVTFSRAYPRVAFWSRILLKPFWQMLYQLLVLTYLVSKWMFLGALAVYRWALPRMATWVAGAVRRTGSRRLKEI
jgi:hypothetical protein